MARATHHDIASSRSPPTSSARTTTSFPRGGELVGTSAAIARVCIIERLAQAKTDHLLYRTAVGAPLPVRLAHAPDTDMSRYRAAVAAARRAPATHAATPTPS